MEKDLRPAEPVEDGKVLSFSNRPTLGKPMSMNTCARMMQGKARFRMVLITD